MIVAVLFALAALCVSASSALAEQATTPSGLTQSVYVDHDNTEAGQASPVSIGTGLYKTDATQPSATTEIDIAFPAGETRNYASLPTCTASTLTNQGPSACSSAFVGSGYMSLDARPSVPQIYQATLSAYNGASGSLLLYVVPTAGSPFVLTGSASGNSINIPVPTIQPIQNGSHAAITSMQLDLGYGTNGNYLVNPTSSCPYSYTFGFRYANGETLSIPATATCVVQGTLAFALSPKSATVAVGAQACLVATESYGGYPIPDETVRFSVSGANTATGAVATDVNGQARFCYTGARAGGDTVRAFDDYDANGTQDSYEPGDTAAITFVAPVVATAPPVAHPRGCKVPKVRGLSLKKAKKKLKRAGCRYKVKGKGKVLSTKPGAGKVTAKAVLVKAKAKSKKHKGKKRKK
jgi:Bacterial Ig-like domain (group 1)/PASTA domain